MIELKPKRQPGYFKIYLINQKEKTILKDYIDKNIKIGKIRKSKSKIGYLIFFVVKKDRRRRPYIDYKQLNDITKKNRYLLPKIDKLQDKLYDKK